MVLCLTLFALAGGGISAGKALLHGAQVNATLSDRAAGVEPRAVDGYSAESEFAIEHPLLRHSRLGADSRRALDLFYESVRCHQDGNEYRALSLYQESTKIDPSLHENARAMLVDIVKDCGLEEAGAAYYWLAIHAEHSKGFKHAAVWYQKASDAYMRRGYKNRASRARCNLGTVKMRLGDSTAMEDYEAAIALNPKNGIAHLNIARTFYSFCNPGDPRFERALDAFADAILADPATYGPRVISSLKDLGYTWKEDLEEVTRRFEAKRDELSGEQTAE
jgi:tetratricopeptide (TPR) repeat protein